MKMMISAFLFSIQPDFCRIKFSKFSKRKTRPNNRKTRMQTIGSKRGSKLVYVMIVMIQEDKLSLTTDEVIKAKGKAGKISFFVTSLPQGKPDYFPSQACIFPLPNAFLEGNMKSVAYASLRIHIQFCIVNSLLGLLRTLKNTYNKKLKRQHGCRICQEAPDIRSASQRREALDLKITARPLFEKGKRRERRKRRKGE